MSPIDVSIIVINYKTFQDTNRCIDSIIQFTKGLSFEIILVENGTAEFNDSNVLKWGKHVRLIVSQDNLGFAGGNNLGIEYAEGRYILLLNSDTYLTEDSITLAVRHFENQPNAGVVSARLIYPNGRVQSVAQRFPSAKYQLVELLRIQKFMNKQKAAQYLLGAFFDHNTNVEADWVWGAFFLTTKEIIAQLPGGKLDDSYFMYWEDVQWCMDIKRLGYSIYFFSDTSVVHIQEGSKGKTNINLINSEQIFFKKNYSKLHFWLIKLLNNCL